MDKERLKEVWVYTCDVDHAKRTVRAEWEPLAGFMTVNGMECPCGKPMRLEDWSGKPGVTTVQETETPEERFNRLRFPEKEPVPTEPDYDPTPWCGSCGARTREKCHCGPIAEND